MILQFDCKLCLLRAILTFYSCFGSFSRYKIPVKAPHSYLMFSKRLICFWVLVSTVEVVLCGFALWGPLLPPHKITFKLTSFTHKISLRLHSLACLCCYQPRKRAVFYSSQVSPGSSVRWQWLYQRSRLYQPVVSVFWMTRLLPLALCVGVCCLWWEMVVLHQSSRGEGERKCICRNQASLVLLFLERVIIISVLFP